MFEICNVRVWKVNVGIHAFAGSIHLQKGRSRVPHQTEALVYLLIISEPSDEIINKN